MTSLSAKMDVHVTLLYEQMSTRVAFTFTQIAPQFKFI